MRPPATTSPGTRSHPPRPRSPADPVHVNSTLPTVEACPPAGSHPGTGSAAEPLPETPDARVGVLPRPFPVGDLRDCAGPAVSMKKSPAGTVGTTVPAGPCSMPAAWEQTAGVFFTAAFFSRRYPARQRARSDILPLCGRPYWGIALGHCSGPALVLMMVGHFSIRRVLTMRYTALCTKAVTVFSAPGRPGSSRSRSAPVHLVSASHPPGRTSGPRSARTPAGGIIYHRPALADLPAMAARRGGSCPGRGSPVSSRLPAAPGQTLHSGVIRHTQYSSRAETPSGSSASSEYHSEKVSKLCRGPSIRDSSFCCSRA